MILKSTRFGDMEISEDQIIHFPNGIPGFPNEKKFVVLPYGEGDNPFFILHSIADPDLSFFMVEPFSFFKDYTFELNDEILHELSLSKDNPPHIFNIVTLHDKLEDMTANLAAPVIVNSRDHLGEQIILEKSGYTTRHLLFPNGLSGKGGE